MPTPGPVAGLIGNRILRLIRQDEIKTVMAPLYLKSEYETLRGLLKLETGDIAGARQHFHQALFANKTFAGREPEVRDIIYPFSGLPMALRYMQMIDKKE